MALSAAGPKVRSHEQKGQRGSPVPDTVPQWSQTAGRGVGKGCAQAAGGGAPR